MNIFSEERYEFIKWKVAETIVNYAERRLPIDPFIIEKRCGITLKRYSEFNEEDKSILLLRSEDGFIDKRSDGLITLLYNDQIYYDGRINFTLAHELAHYFLGHLGNLTIDDNTKEKEANLFAKNLLCPPVVLSQLPSLSPETIKLFCNVGYTASIYAMNYFYKWEAKTGGTSFKYYEEAILDFFQSYLDEINSFVDNSALLELNSICQY